MTSNHYPFADLLKRDNVSNFVLVEPMFDRNKGTVLSKSL